MFENNYSFDIPANHKSIIKVIGVGGGGSNAVNHMYNLGIKDVEFVICNTDVQALESSPIPTKLQIGINLTSGLGAGANPEKGRNAAIESKEEIKEMLSDGTKMVFITAGMGGGTGTGAAPVIAQVAKELDILTVGIVTSPFGFEGRKKMNQANEGIRSLKENCDTVLVIMNDKIKEIFGNLPIREAFGQADNVLTTASKGIAEIITVPGYVNVDFEDVKTVMVNAGAAVMGSAETHGDNRATRAAEAALNSPLLNNHDIKGAEKILLSIVSGEEAELQMDELTEITDYMQEIAGDEADVIFGHGIDADLGENIRVTVIATGFVTPDEMELKRTPVEEQDTKVAEPIRFEIEDRRAAEKPGYSESNGKRYHDLEKSEGINQFELFGQSDPNKRNIEDEQDEVPSDRPFSFREIPHEDPIEARKEDSFEDEDLDFDFLKEDEQEKVPVNRGMDFDFDFPEKEPEKEEDEFDFEFDGDFEFEPSMSDEPEEEDHPLEELQDMAHQPSRKLMLMEQRRKREEELASANKSAAPISPDAFKEKWEVPAYERKKVKLQEVPHSSEQNISRYNLTDDNNLLGNNKFLHDNVD
ncbi:MAG: cell division protein FtsZ [Cyclobacteriaceae bacterium]